MPQNYGALSYKSVSADEQWQPRLVSSEQKTESSTGIGWEQVGTDCQWQTLVIAKKQTEESEKPK